MSDLREVAVAEELQRRILQLRPDNQRAWGSMTLPQTLAHCTAGLEMALGELSVAPAKFPVRLLGRLIKPLVLRGDRPMKRNVPSAPELFVSEPARCEFEPERERLLAAVARFPQQADAGNTQHPHPFFGRMKPEEWGRLAYKHLDHHLRQFGA